MKKLNQIVFAALAVLALASCSPGDDDPIPSYNRVDGASTFKDTSGVTHYMYEYYADTSVPTDQELYLDDDADAVTKSSDAHRIYDNGGVMIAIASTGSSTNDLTEAAFVNADYMNNPKFWTCPVLVER